MATTRGTLLTLFVCAATLLAACEFPTNGIPGYDEAEDDQLLEAPPKELLEQDPLEAPPPAPEPDYSGQGVALNYTTELVNGVTGEVRGWASCETLSPVPPHWWIEFDLAYFSAGPGEAYLAVYPVADFLDLCDAVHGPAGGSRVWVEETLAPLREAIAAQSDATNIPPLPLVNAGEPLHERSRFLAFQNGGGVRAIVSYAQDLWFFHNQSLSYYFQGLTDDGLYYIAARFPVTAPFLIDGPEPGENTNADAIPIPEYDLTDYDAFAQIVETYNNEARARFATAADADFGPDLAVLDALIMSLFIDPDPSDLEVDLPPSAGACTASIQSQVTTYQRPSFEAEPFAPLEPGLVPYLIYGRTADGWLAFNPGMLNAGNTGVFIYRWMHESADLLLQGACAALPELVGPPPGVCFTMPMEDVPVYAQPDTAANQLTTLVMDDYAAVTGLTGVGWAQVDLAQSSVGGSQIGWIEAATLNLNGPCESVPNVTP
jgi:hypothetical protein